MAESVSVDDLLFAVDWLANGYEGADDDPNVAAGRRVAAWLQAEVARRNRSAEIRRLAAEVSERTGRRANDPAVLAAARRVLAGS